MDHSHRWVWNIPMDHLWGGLTSRVVNSVRASLREHTRRYPEKRNPDSFTAYERLLNAYPARRMKKIEFNHKRKISGDKRSPALLDSEGIILKEFRF